MIHMSTNDSETALAAATHILALHLLVLVVLLMVEPASLLLTFVFLFALSICNLAFCLTAAIKALRGEVWTYPLTLHIVEYK